MFAFQSIDLASQSEMKEEGEGGGGAATTGTGSTQICELVVYEH